MKEIKNKNREKKNFIISLAKRGTNYLKKMVLKLIEEITKCIRKNKSIAELKILKKRELGNLYGWPLSRGPLEIWPHFIKNARNLAFCLLQLRMKVPFWPQNVCEAECNPNFSLFPLVLDSFLSLLHLIPQFMLLSFFFSLIFSICLNSSSRFFLSFLPLISYSSFFLFNFIAFSF